MEIPDKLRHIIEALRGGGETTIKDGVVTGQSYGGGSTNAQRQPPLDNRRRLYQLYAQEQRAQGAPVSGYNEWLSSF